MEKIHILEAEMLQGRNSYEYCFQYMKVLSIQKGFFESRLKRLSFIFYSILREKCSVRIEGKYNTETAETSFNGRSGRWNSNKMKYILLQRKFNEIQFPSNKKLTSLR
jgi:hypothetical protein